MTPAEPRPTDADPRREWAFVSAMTAVGLVIRGWSLGRLGLVHFDEGIYAFAGAWSLQGGGLDPTLIPYAPPGFPFLVGLAYKLMGPVDLAPILVSIAAGTLAIPAAAWLAYRTFGRGAGAAAAALAAASGFHVAFSRMGLTDATFTLAWLVGLIAGQRFLEVPNASNAVRLGLATGLAQLVKYSGWTVGIAVVLAVAMIVALNPSRRAGAFQRRVWGWGVLAALVAAAVYAPWVFFVERNGGYAGLMAHHRGYMGTAATWLPHWKHQLDQATLLSGGFAWNVAGWTLALAGAAIARWPVRLPAAGWAGVVALSVAAIAAPTSPWWIGLVPLIVSMRGASPAIRLLAVAWLGLSILTPFYHPYSRLWLPLQSLGWVVMAGVVAGLLADGAGEAPAVGRWTQPLTIGCCLAALAYAALVSAVPIGAAPNPGVLAPSDSVRRAVGELVRSQADGPPPLRVLTRPPINYYYMLSGGQVRVADDIGDLLARSNRNWILVDSAQLSPAVDRATLKVRLTSRWSLVETYPTTLNLPTLLDVDPGAAFGRKPEAADAPLWFLRPQAAGGPR